MTKERKLFPNDMVRDANGPSNKIDDCSSAWDIAKCCPPRRQSFRPQIAPRALLKVEAEKTLPSKSMLKRREQVHKWKR